MIILLQNRKLYFNIKIKENNFYYDNEIFNYNSFNNFIKNSLSVESIDNDIDDDEYLYDIVNENLSYLELTLNPITKKNIYFKLAKLLIFNDWIRNSNYIQVIFDKFENKDKYFKFLKIILSNLETTTKIINKDLNNNKKKLFEYLSFNDFLYDYYN